MNALSRAAFAGAVIGVAEVLIYRWWPAHLEDHLPMLVAPFVLGAALGRLLKLPRWGLVAGLAPLVNIALLLFTLRGEATFDDLMDAGVWLGAFVFVAVGVNGHLAATALFVSGRVGLRVGLAAAIVLGTVGAATTSAQIADLAQERRLETSGVPLVAPVLDGYGFVGYYLDERRPSLELHYWRLDDESYVEVDVRPAGTVTAQEACGGYDPAYALDDQPVECEETTANVWLRTEPTERSLFVEQGGALIEITSEKLERQELLDIAPSFRPISAQDLVAGGQL
ncbi:hypothetical protein HII36_39170 [Nonomuraea sp. NN258]|uniref:hypothetical protein n=1 Tax=Nonomuraea antri TaxID=2730852 RepID=UPI0015699EFA|nr:hypothetical protein [Nonomuraea antri]NRQ37810.1 hypothetical protein [Nonomuraea antri]